MTTDIRTIQTIRATQVKTDWQGKRRKEISFFSGYSKKSSYMHFSDDPTKAVELVASTPEERIQLLTDARGCAFSSYKDYIFPQLEWVEIEVKTEVSTWVQPIEVEPAAMDILKAQLINDLTPLEIKALGLQKDAIYLKLQAG